VKKFDEAKHHHDYFVRAYERRERAYRGVLSRATQVDKWKHNYHPRFAFNLIETCVANTVEMGLQFNVRPSPHINVSVDEATHMLDQAKSVEYLLRHQHRVDAMDDKQRPLFLTDAIGGRGIGKEYWNWSKGILNRQGVVHVPVTSDSGVHLGTVPTIQQITEEKTLRNHSTFEVIDPRDFIVHESAKDIRFFEPGGAQWIIHRCWYSMEQLRMLEAGGYVKNVNDLLETRDQTDEYKSRESEVFNINRTKNLIECLEYWCLDQGQAKRTMVGQRNVLLRDTEATPFWHGDNPFIMANAMPNPFSTIGTSSMELVEQLQEILWEVTNQKLDNIELINNAIYLIRSDIDDPEAFEHYPGARWPVTSPNDVSSLQPPYQLATITSEIEASLKGDMQNITSAAPFAGGTDSGNIDQTTATGVSIVMTNAQKALQARKYQAQKGLEREANMRIKNCQQFCDDNTLVQTIGEDGAVAFKSLSILDIQGEYFAELHAMGESDNLQQKRADAGQKLQILLQGAPMFAAAGVPLDLKALGIEFLKAYGDIDAERFFTAPGAPGAVPPGAPAPQGAPPGAATGSPENPAQPNLGVTAGSAVDASSPSAAGGMSMSPVTALSRALSMNGGVSNA
jgi:hypothetical protein